MRLKRIMNVHNTFSTRTVDISSVILYRECAGARKSDVTAGGGDQVSANPVDGIYSRLGITVHSALGIDIPGQRRR